MCDKTQRTIKNLYDLPTYQRRLRHLRSVAVRNLLCKSCHGKDITKLQVYFTLHVDEKSKEFYKSEVIAGSLNPTWQSFDISRFEDEVDTQTKSLVVRVWVGYSTDKGHFKLLIDWTINLTGLVFFAEKLQQDKLKYSSNMVILGMFDQYFTAPEVPLSSEEEVMVVDPGGVRNSYTINSLSRIHTVLRAIKQMQASVKRVHRSIEDKLLSSQERSRQLSAREDLEMRLVLLRNELSWQTTKLQQEKEIYDKQIQDRKKHSASLQQRFAELESSKENLLEKRKQYFQTRESYIKENAQLLIRRKQLISELTLCIYPISEKEKVIRILGVRLPNSEDFQGCDETMLAVALGYTCHLVMMMSHILDFPLRYLMEYRGSRSQIMDLVHPKLTDKDRTFPLFTKGREKFQFNYGVFLLNKNISQLRFYCGLGTTELKLTLPNIKTMLELRLGVKFDHGTQLPVSDYKEGASNVSNEKAETISSLASGGRCSARDPAEMALEAALSDTRKLQTPTSDKDRLTVRDNVTITLNTISKTECDEKEDLFKGNEDNFFKSVRGPMFDQMSYGNSSGGSVGDQTNGDIQHQNNFLHGHSPQSDVSTGSSTDVHVRKEEKDDHSISNQSCDLTPAQAAGETKPGATSHLNCIPTENSVSDSNIHGNQVSVNSNYGDTINCDQRQEGEYEDR